MIFPKLLHTSSGIMIAISVVGKRLIRISKFSEVQIKNNWREFGDEDARNTIDKKITGRS